jgi:hypothetical protein
MGEIRNAYNTLVAKTEGEDSSEDLGVDEKIILEWILGKEGGKLWTERICSGQGPVAGFVNTVMNLQVPYKAGNFLTS